jgi:oligopeptide/dipeptide ABC transporter ATP-binding protein
MYAGQLMELADNEEIFTNPMHPYTKALLSAVAIPDLDNKKKKTVLKGQVPSLINPPSGCRFHPRCSFYSKICSDKRPEIKKVRDGHFVACHNA